MKPPTFADVYCGAGLFTAGLERAGLRSVLGLDLNPVALSSYRANFQHALAWEIDVLDLVSLPRVDVVVGGPPCQPFSGANRTPNPAAGLPFVRKFIELAVSSGAEYWIMEEVPPVEKYVRELLPEGARVEVYECAAYGARNLRKRLFAGVFPDPVPALLPCSSPAPTVLATDSGLTIQEMRDSQGVPDWMEFHGGDGEQRRQIGNGIPLAMGEALGLGIIYDMMERKVGGHRPNHRTQAALYRDTTGSSRVYHSGPGAVWCRDCKRFVLDEL